MSNESESKRRRSGRRVAISSKASEVLESVRASTAEARGRLVRVCPQPDKDPNSRQSMVANSCKLAASQAGQFIVREQVDKLQLTAPASFYSASAAFTRKIRPYTKKQREEKRCIQINGKNAPWRMVGNQRAYDMRCGSISSAKPCVTKERQSGPHRSCILNFVFVAGKPYIRACTYAGKAGRIFPVKDFDHAIELARSLCERSKLDARKRIRYEEPEPSAGLASGAARKWFKAYG